MCSHNSVFCALHVCTISSTSGKIRRVQKPVQKSLSEIVRIYFKKIALLDIVQNKYVSADVFLDLMHYNYSYIDVIKNLKSILESWKKVGDNLLLKTVNLGAFGSLFCHIIFQGWFFIIKEKCYSTA